MTTTLTRSSAVPRALSNAWTAWFMATALSLGALTLTPAPARAGVVSETAEIFAGKVTDDPVAQKEIGNAADALIKLAPAAVEVAGNAGAKGTAGVSGPFEELVVNFDKMACAAWIISFRDTLLGAMLKRDPETPPETIQAAQNLLNKVVFACRKVLDPDTKYGTPGGGTGTTGTTGTTGGVPPDGPGAQGVDIVDGRAVLDASDRICWNRCADKWAAWKNAEAMRDRAERRLTAARLRLDTLVQSEIPAEERAIAAKEAHIAWLKSRPRSQYIDGQIVRNQNELGAMRAVLAENRAQAEALRAEIPALEASLPTLRAAEQAALKAYLDCLKACADQARAASKPSSFAEQTLEALTPRLQIGSRLPVRFVPEDSATGTVRAEAFAQFLTGEASLSGTEVVLAVPFGRDLGGRTRAAAVGAMEAARSRQFEHGRDDGQPSALEPVADTPEPSLEPTYAAPPAEVVEDSAGPQEFIEFQPPARVQPPVEFYCPDHPGMGPHSH